MRKIFILFLLLVLIYPQAAFAKRKGKLVIPEGSGYVGTLPDPTKRFNADSIPSFESDDGFNKPEEIKPAPTNNPAFVNIIMKKDKTSQYINDLRDIIFIVENLQTAIEDGDSVQKFNARSYELKENVEYFRDKYKNKAEESYISYRKVMTLNTHIQSIAQLRLEKEVFSPYVISESNGNAFSQNTIDNQLNYLLDDIKSTLVILKEAK